MWTCCCSWGFESFAKKKTRKPFHVQKPLVYRLPTLHPYIINSASIAVFALRQERVCSVSVCSVYPSNRITVDRRTHSDFPPPAGEHPFETGEFPHPRETILIFLKTYYVVMLQ